MHRTNLASNSMLVCLHPISRQPNSRNSSNFHNYILSSSSSSSKSHCRNRTMQSQQAGISRIATIEARILRNNYHCWRNCCTWINKAFNQKSMQSRIPCRIARVLRISDRMMKTSKTAAAEAKIHRRVINSWREIWWNNKCMQAIKRMMVRKNINRLVKIITMKASKNILDKGSSNMKVVMKMTIVEW